MTTFMQATNMFARTIFEYILLFPLSIVGMIFPPPQLFRTIIIILSGWGSGYFWEKVAKSPRPRMRALQTIMFLLLGWLVYIYIFITLPTIWSIRK